TCPGFSIYLRQPPRTNSAQRRHKLPEPQYSFTISPVKEQVLKIPLPGFQINRFQSFGCGGFQLLQRCNSTSLLKKIIVRFRLTRQKHQVIKVPSLSPGQHRRYLHTAQYPVGGYRKREEESAPADVGDDGFVFHPLVLAFDLDEEPFFPMAAQPHIKQQLREMDIATESGQFGVIPIPCFHLPSRTLQKTDNGIGHLKKFVFGKVL